MRIVLADADLTEFDWVGFVGAWVIAWTPLLLLPPPLSLIVAFSALYLWMGWRKKRAARLEE